MIHYVETILCMHPANERRCYIVTSSLIGWVYTQNFSWSWRTKYPRTFIYMLRLLNITQQLGPVILHLVWPAIKFYWVCKVESNDNFSNKIESILIEYWRLQLNFANACSSCHANPPQTYQILSKILYNFSIQAHCGWHRLWSSKNRWHCGWHRLWSSKNRWKRTDI